MSEELVRLPVLVADSIGARLSSWTQPSLTLELTVHEEPWVVKLVCGDSDERRWGPASEFVASRLLDLMSVEGRPPAAFIRVPWPDAERLGAKGSLGFGWEGEPRRDLTGLNIPAVPEGREWDAVAQDAVLRWLGAHEDHRGHNFTSEAGFPMAIDFGGTIHSYSWDSATKSDKPIDIVYGSGRANQVWERSPGLAASVASRAELVSNRLGEILDQVPDEWATPSQRANACQAIRARLPDVVAYYA